VELPGQPVSSLLLDGWRDQRLLRTLHVRWLLLLLTLESFIIYIWTDPIRKRVASSLVTRRIADQRVGVIKGFCL